MNKHVSELFDEVADLTDGARSRYFAECHVSDDTRVEVEGLLAFDCGWTTSLKRDLGRVARIASEDEDVEPVRIGWLKRHGGGDGLIATDVVELVPEARRRSVGAGELAVGPDRDGVGSGGTCLRLSAGQDANQERADEQDDCPGCESTIKRR